jgi:acyl-CoA reductase-like NAD-dependent aldehyde dehydrogenase
VAHKVAPAIATGCPFVLKPASSTPISAILLGEILAETDWPREAFSIVPCKSTDAEALITDERIKLLSFTGSPEVGWSLKAKAGKKKVVLELGGNAAVIADEGVDVSAVAERLVVGAFYQSGQSCISVQRIYAHDSIYDRLKQVLREKTVRLKSGDPMKQDTFLGPMITLEDAKRIEQWVDEAVEGGARLICGGKRNGVFYEATLLENVDPQMRISCVEAFGPVATLDRFSDFGDAVRRVNDSRYGLQAGVFTNNLSHAMHAFNELEVGGVIINDVPSFRVDNMPYGGVKDSGFGREGVRWSMEEMTELRLMVLRR